MPGKRRRVRRRKAEQPVSKPMPHHADQTPSPSGPSEPSPPESGSAPGKSTARWWWGGGILLGLLVGVFVALPNRTEPPQDPNPQFPSETADANWGAQDPQAQRPTTDQFVDPEVVATATILSRSQAEDLDNPTRDGWTSESRHLETNKQLKQITKLFAEPGKITHERLAPFVHADVRCSELAPPLSEVFADAKIRVRRPAAPAIPKEDASDELSEAQHQGIDAVAVALADYFAIPPDCDTSQVELKITGLNFAQSWTTRVMVEWVARGASESLAKNATWICDWSKASGDAAPRLTHIRQEQYEEISVASTAGRLLTDYTAAVLGGNASFRRQLTRGEDFWAGRIQSSVHTTFVGLLGGMALGDVNGDGLDDLYVCQPGGLPDRLFVQNPDGTATDVSAAAGVDWLEFSSSALFLDLDNDADEDLALLGLQGLILMANDGHGRFAIANVLESPRKPISLTAADYDADGDLDLYVVCYGPDGAQTDKDHLLRPVEFMSPVPYDDAKNGAPNILFRNDGNWQFVDATSETGLDAINTRWSLAASWEDYDNDGDVDLYVANDFGRNNLYRNDDGKFVEVAATAGVGDVASGMSVSWGDYNNDGWIDLYVGNMYSTAGGRITDQEMFQPGADPDRVAQFRRMARGNTLFENRGDGTFRDVSRETGVTMGRWAWSSRFADINNDGRRDLLIANGFITNENTHDL